MKHIKPGRGPSMIGGVGGVIAALFGVLWTVVASNIGAPPLFAGFGVLFVVGAVVIAVYEFTNATRKNRFSAFDITDDSEEPDPLNARFGGEAAFCPACGAKVQHGARFCAACGQKLPE